MSILDKAGKELDTLIIEKVMQFPIVDIEVRLGVEGWRNYPVARWWKEERAYLVTWEKDQDGMKFRPSRDMRDVWAVVRRMRHFNPMNNLHLVEYAYNRAYACFGPHFGEETAQEGNGEYCSSIAICKAALYAVEHQE